MRVETITVAFDVYDLTVMEQWVEYRCCDHGLSEQYLTVPRALV
jgi:hypothetical protein